MGCLDGTSGVMVNRDCTVVVSFCYRVVPLYKSGQVDHDVAKYLNR